MKRIPLTSGTGAWFDSDAAISFREGERHDGNNFISLATGSQWDHQKLYYTSGGRWILNEYSQYQGSLETYRQIDLDEAVAWLTSNERVGSSSGNAPWDLPRRFPGSA